MAVVALMVALVAGSAAAKQGGKNMVTYNFKGTIEEVGADGNYLVVDVTGGDRAARGHAGLQEFGVTPATRIEVDDQAAALSDLVPGDEVKVQSKAARDATEFAARKVSVENETEEG
jgi:hypothetical protein